MSAKRTTSSALRTSLRSKNPRESICLSTMVNRLHPITWSSLTAFSAGIARDDNTSYSKAGKPDFSDAQSISEHLMKSEPENWQDTFQTNITGQFFTTAAFLPLLAKGGDATPGYTSSVVNVASISGVMKGSSSGQFAYATSKAGEFPGWGTFRLVIACIMLILKRLHPPYQNDGYHIYRGKDSRQLHRAWYISQ